MRERFGHHLKIGLWIIVGFFVISCFVGYGSSIYSRAMNPEETTVAKVNGEEIPREQFAAMYENAIESSSRPMSAMQTVFVKSQVLDQLIDQAVRLQAARQERIRISRDEIRTEKERLLKEQIDQIRQYVSQGKPLSDADFEKQVKVRYRMTLAMLKQNIEQRLTDDAVREKLMLDKLEAKIKEQVPMPKEADLEKKYTEVHARHILIDFRSRSEEQARKRAEKVLAKVKAGGDFAKLAKDYSDDPGSKNKGGDLGYFRHGMMAP